MRSNDNIIAYIGTIWDDIQGLDENGIRELILSDIALMDEETANYTMNILDDIIDEALKELEDRKEQSNEVHFNILSSETK